jgi:hypothetical protein
LSLPLDFICDHEIEDALEQSKKILKEEKDTCKSPVERTIYQTVGNKPA